MRYPGAERCIPCAFEHRKTRTPNGKLRARVEALEGAIRGVLAADFLGTGMAHAMEMMRNALSCDPVQSRARSCDNEKRP